MSHAMQMWHNGNALDFALVNCFDGFFVQVTVTCGRALLDNIVAAAPIIVPQLHVDPVVLPHPQFLQVTANVPGGGHLNLLTLCLCCRSSRSGFRCPSDVIAAAVSRHVPCWV